MNPEDVSGPEVPTVDSLSAALARSTMIGGKVRHTEVHPSLPSTNATALEDARDSLLVVALEQTGGRGRHGTFWASPPGGLYLSFAPPLPLVPERPTDISLLAALAVADAIDTTLESTGTTTVHALLKWPNDVLVGDGKVAGVLVQSRPDQDPSGGGPRAVVGVGVNVNTTVTIDGPLDGHTTEWPVRPRSLREVTGRPLDIPTLLVAIVEGLLLRIERGLNASAVEEYRSRCITIGKRVVFTDGDTRRFGTALDISPEDGGLLLRLEDGEMRKVTSGDVRHIRSEKG
jgi:BirA family biotin operon repressor/biotin-[acetyl-CoA-carboxylase] ligase